MGLCKCPKKVVSNLFCFDHRVTVCESCLILNHRKCVIQSYLQWLKDSDFDSTCSLCGTDLESDDCIRLICYDLFHKKCLENRQIQLVKATQSIAPSGHKCPKCDACIFPQQNIVSPVADALRIWLSQVTWGRNEINITSVANTTTSFDENEFISRSSKSQENIMKNEIVTMASSVINNSDVGHHQQQQQQQQQQQHHRTNLPEKVFRPDSILNIESRPLLRERDLRSSDRDDNKYKRKTPQEIFSRWSRQFYSPASKPPWKRTWFILLSGISVFIMIIYLMYHFGRSANDSELDNFHYEE